MPVPGPATRWALRLLLVAASLLMGFIALEAVLRVASPGQVAPAFRALFMPDDRIGYRLRPGASGRYETPEFATDIAINATGVRDDRELDPKAPGEFRIVVLGDSMVMAVQVPIEQTFVRRLEHRLNAAPGGRRYRVINAGVQGYGTVEQALFFTHVAAGFEPDLVLLAVFVGNDAVESAAAEHRLHEHEASGGAAPQAASAESARVPLALRRLARRSAAVQFLRLHVLAALGPGGPLPLRERVLDSYAVDPPPEVIRGFKTSRRAARRIVDEAATLGADTAVFFLPARFQVVDRDFTDLSAETGRGGLRLDRDAATHRFLAAYATLDVPQLDVLPRFHAEADPAALYFGRNVHLTTRGHEVLAETLDEFLRAEALVPAASRSEP